MAQESKMANRNRDRQDIAAATEPSVPIATATEPQRYMLIMVPTESAAARAARSIDLRSNTHRSLIDIIDKMPQPPAPWEGEFSIWKAIARWGYLYERALLALTATSANPRPTIANSATVGSDARHKQLQNNKSASEILYEAWTVCSYWKESSE